MADCTGIFLDYSARKLRQNTARIAECLGRLTDEQIWARGAETENAAGNLVLHLAGNVRQWVVAGVGGKEDTRRRDQEFAARGGQSGAQLVAHLKSVVEEAAAVIEAIPAADLTRALNIQNYRVTVLEAVYHVTEHFSGHTGQIIFATKLFTAQDMEFHRHLRTTGAHTEPTP